MLEIGWKIGLSPIKEFRDSGKCPLFITTLKSYNMGRTVLPASYKRQISDCSTKETITFFIYDSYSELMNDKK